MAIVETLSLVAVIVGLIYFYFARNHGFWAKKRIPYEPPVVIFGNFLQTILGKTAFGEVHESIYKKFKGDKVVGIFNFTSPALMIRDPALISKMMTTDFHHFANNDVEISEEVDPVMASNIFVQTGEKWKRSRQAMSPAYTVNRIKSTFDKIQSVAEKFTKYLETHPEVELKSTMSLYTSEIVASWGIGIDGHAFDSDDPILPKLGKLMFESNFKSLVTFTIFSFSPALANFFKLKFVPDDIPNFFNGVVRDLIDSRSNSDTQHKDFLQYFLDLKKKRSIHKNDDQDDISDKDIMNGIVSFFLEGYETSSIMLTFLLYHLTLDQNLQQQLRKEVDMMYTSGSPDFDAISDNALLGHIFSETVRVYGMFALAKKCTEDCVLDLGDGKTLMVEKGTSVVYPIRSLQNDPEYWDEPEKFKPSRWAQPGTVKVKGSYLPFGDGPRMCIGMRIATAMIKTAVVNIVRNFELLRTKNTPAKFTQDPNHFMTLMKGGIPIRFSKRTNFA